MTRHHLLFDSDLEAYRAVVAEFARREILPRRQESGGFSTDTQLYAAAASQGVIGLTGPHEHGGSGITDWRYRMVVAEELCSVGAAGVAAAFAMQDEAVVPLLAANPGECASRWLPDIVAGQATGTIAVSGRCDARPSSEGWELTGRHDYVSVPSSCAVVIASAFIGDDLTPSLFVVPLPAVGVEPVELIGLGELHVSHLVFDDVVVDEGALLGVRGGAEDALAGSLLRQHLSIAIQAMAATRAAFDWTLTYSRDRIAFGKPIAAFQNSQFVIAEMAVELDALTALLDSHVLSANDDELSPIDAAKAKLWASEVHARTVDRCLQLFGGYGYMMEYSIAQAYLDARTLRIYGSSNEQLKVQIAREVSGVS